MVGGNHENPGKTMKFTHYDILQLSPKATPELIKTAYTHLKPTLLEAANEGSEDAKNQLLFLEEAYAVLSSPEKRSAYDAKIYGESARQASPQSFVYEGDNAFQGYWRDSATGRILITAVLFGAVFSAYKFIGQRGEQKVLEKQVEVQEKKETGVIRNDGYRAETERSLVQGVVQNQEKLIDKSYDIAAREAERRKTELEYRANAGAQQMEMQRQRQEAMLQDQRWRQEQQERDRQSREAKALADAPQKQLCNMYALNGKTQDAQAAGCYRYR